MKSERKYIVYKITCDINGKIYIGQTYETINKRFKRHIDFAYKDERSKDLKFSRAIRKYGAEHFHIEQIEECKSQDELDDREWYWINYYNAVEEGYNTKDSRGKCGGDTWTNNPRQDEIRAKLREGKLGDKNPMKKYGYKVAGERNGMHGKHGADHPFSKKCVAVNIYTNETIIFESQVEAARYVRPDLKGTNFVSERVRKVKINDYMGWIFYNYEEYLEAQQTTESVDNEKDVIE